MIGDYAESVGLVRALEAMERLASRPSVTVYSASRLNIEGPGVEETELPGPDAAERFRYSGLKLLFRANEKYFLVPEGGRPRTAPRSSYPTSKRSGSSSLAPAADPTIALTRSQSA